jgi:hypothetical protein
MSDLIIGLMALGLTALMIWAEVEHEEMTTNDKESKR